jgi:hypothetical protein
METVTSTAPVKRRSHVVGWSIGLVSLCGLLLGYYILSTYFQPIPHQYQLDFGNAKWIQPANGRPIAYFRTDIYLNAAPEQAWLEVSAMDNFKAIINSHSVGSQDSVKTRVAEIVDIKKRLKAGTNVIAISTSRASYPGAAQILVRGFIRQQGGKITEFVSDEHWRVATETGIVPGSEDWTSSLVQDQSWPSAVLSPANQSHVDIDYVDLNPLIVQLEPGGAWIQSENASSEATFSTTIQADRAREETWVQVAGSGNLDLLVNGQLITSSIDYGSDTTREPHLLTQSSESSSNQVKGARAEERATRPSKSSGSPFEKTTLEAYDVSFWIRKGANSIIATVRADQHPASFFLSGFFVGNDGGVREFSTNSSWKAIDKAGAPATSDHSAIEIGADGVAPWGYLPQELARPIDRSNLFTYAKYVGVVAGVTAGVIGLWLLVAGLVANKRGETFRRLMARDALFHTPVIIGLLLLFLPNYDVRFPLEWSFQPRFIFAGFVLLFGVRLFHLFPGGPIRAQRKPWWEINRDTLRAKAPYIFLVLIVSLGFALRFHNFSQMSFDHDEMGLVTKSKGIYTLGIPYTVYAGGVRWITTYELVPYPLALAGLFGYSEFTMRFPSLIMGTLCIALIALIGRRLFSSWRIGLIAAFIYACMPLDIRWAQNCFYPQQCQFMALLTTLLFYEAIRHRPFHTKYLTAAAISFCLTYISWEGSAFLLPSLFVGLFVVRWGEWWWLKQLHLYRCIFLIGAVVVAQFCSRTIAGESYLQVGSGLSNLTGPSLFFLTPAYQPLFYINKLLFSENHVPFTIMALIGLPFCWSQSGYRYLFSMLVSLWVCHTNFLAALAPRYCYYYQPFVIMTGVAATVLLYDRVLALARRESYSPVGWICAHTAGIGVILFLFLQSNEWLFRDYELSDTGNTPGLMTRMGMYRYNYRDADHYVKDHLQPGDVVLPGIPHVYAFYAGQPGDYFLDTLLASKVPYNQLLSEPRFVDKFGGLPVVRNLAELKEITNRAPRTWIIFAPYASFEKLTAANVLEYLNQNAKIVYETYRAKVFLIEGHSETQPTRGGMRTAQMAE